MNTLEKEDFVDFCLKCEPLAYYMTFVKGLSSFGKSMLKLKNNMVYPSFKDYR